MFRWELEKRLGIMNNCQDCQRRLSDDYLQYCDYSDEAAEPDIICVMFLEKPIASILDIRFTEIDDE